MKRYLGKEVAAAVFYSAGALAPGEWLTQEAPEGATGGLPPSCRSAPP